MNTFVVSLHSLDYLVLVRGERAHAKARRRKGLPACSNTLAPWREPSLWPFLFVERPAAGTGDTAGSRFPKSVALGTNEAGVDRNIDDRKMKSQTSHRSFSCQQYSCHTLFSSPVAMASRQGKLLAHSSSPFIRWIISFLCGEEGSRKGAKAQRIFCPRILAPLRLGVSLLPDSGYSSSVRRGDRETWRETVSRIQGQGAHALTLGRITGSTGSECRPWHL